MLMMKITILIYIITHADSVGRCGHINKQTNKQKDGAKHLPTPTDRVGVGRCLAPSICLFVCLSVCFSAAYLKN